jgi:hypothetical protein
MGTLYVGLSVCISILISTPTKIPQQWSQIEYTPANPDQLGAEVIQISEASDIKKLKRQTNGKFNDISSAD